MTDGFRKFIHGISWGGLSTLVNVLFQIMFMAAMARLLDPSHFGMIALANVMLRFLTYFAQLGVGPALIQKTELVDGDLRAALSVSVGISALCTVAAMVFAPFAATFFNVPLLATVIQTLSFSFLLNGVSIISVSLLRRNMQFKRIAMIETSAYIFGYGCAGVLAAYLGLGVWALVIAVLSQSTITMVFSYLCSQHEIGWRHSKQQRVHFLKFGANYSLIGFIEFLSGSLDALIIGKIFGASSAGIYGRASLMANLPVQQPANIITRALFPVLSRLGNERQIMTLQLTTLLLGSYALAVSLSIICAAPDLVIVLLGEKWHEAVPILQILALAIAPQYLSHLVGVTLDSMGLLAPKLRIQAAVLCLQVIAFLSLYSYGMTGIALAIVITEWVRFFIMTHLIMRLLKPPRGQFKNIFFVVIYAGLIAVALAWIVSRLMPLDYPHWLRLILQAATGAFALAIVFWTSRKLIGRLTVIEEVARRIPSVAKLIS